MRKFETKVEFLKYQVLREVARLAWQDALLENVTEIPKSIAPGKIPTMRCCVYKERAILSERVRLAIGGNRLNKRVIQTIDIACEDCPTGGYEVTSACRGCLAHRCEQACKKNAISFGHDQKAYIDKTKCVECGLCAKSCPFNAIHNYKRPCEQSCKVKAISMGKDKEAVIDYEDCLSCGACVSACPFGAITDRSYILDVIDLLSRRGGGEKVYALIAPSVAGQFPYIKLGQLISAVKALGFDEVYEVALGADMVAESESKELEEKGFLLSSCCPAFVSYVEKNFPQLKEHISHNLSPAGTLAKLLKEKNGACKTVFIGPCTAKKTERQRDEYKDLIDCVLTFAELQALIDGKGIEMESLPENTMNQASPYGRRFARSGGVAEAVKEALAERGSSFEVKAVSCSGIDECRAVLLKRARGVLDANFIEGMACAGGCVGGAGCVIRDEKNGVSVERHGGEAVHKTIQSALDIVTNSNG